MANIWTQMSYTPPRGPCSQKTSLVTSCACYRFMIHPLKLSSSFSCDGCGHHASFHRMESKEDEEVARRWRGEEGASGRDIERQGIERQNGLMRIEDVGQGGFVRIEEVVGGDMKKRRRRIVDKPEEEVVEVEGLGGGVEGRVGVVGRKRKGRGG